MDLDDVLPVEAFVAVFFEVFVEELESGGVVYSVDDGLFPVGGYGETVDEAGAFAFVDAEVCGVYVGSVGDEGYDACVGGEEYGEVVFFIVHTEDELDVGGGEEGGFRVLLVDVAAAVVAEELRLEGEEERVVPFVDGVEAVFGVYVEEVVADSSFEGGGVGEAEFAGDVGLPCVSVLRYFGLPAEVVEEGCGVFATFYPVIDEELGELEVLDAREFPRALLFLVFFFEFLGEEVWVGLEDTGEVFGVASGAGELFAFTDVLVGVGNLVPCVFEQLGVRDDEVEAGLVERGEAGGGVEIVIDMKGLGVEEESVADGLWGVLGVVCEGGVDGSVIEHEPGRRELSGLELLGVEEILKFGGVGDFDTEEESVAVGHDGVGYLDGAGGVGAQVEPELLRDG